MLIPRRVSRRVSKKAILADRDALGAAYVDSQVALEVEKQARHVAQLRAQRLQDDLYAVTSAKRNWAEDIAGLRRELEAAETSAVTAHKRADEWDTLSNRVKDRLDVEIRRHLKTRAKLARAHRLIRTLWASRRQLQARLATYVVSDHANAAVDAAFSAIARREIEELRDKVDGLQSALDLAHADAEEQG